MPERIVGMLTGSMPEPILVVPSETWKTFELKGEKEEYVVAELVATWEFNEKLFDIDEEIKCKTREYVTHIGSKGTGIIVPREITQKYGIRMSHYLETLLKKVEKAGKSLEIFPQREVTDNCPDWWKRVAKE